MIKYLLFNESAIDLITSQIETNGTIETGGVLLGYFEGEAGIVIKATPPGPKAIHEDIYFRADKDYIDMLIDIEYANTAGRVTYIGEWHTHPQVNPMPSDMDLESISDIVYSYSATPVVLAIVGAISYKREKFTERCFALVADVKSDKMHRLSVGIFRKGDK